METARFTEQEAVNKVITVLGELEATLEEPFNRFANTVGADAVDLNFEYIIRVSLYRRLVYGSRPPIKSAILATDAALVQRFTHYYLKVPRSKPVYSRIAKKLRTGLPYQLNDWRSLCSMALSSAPGGARLFHLKGLNSAAVSILSFTIDKRK